MTMEKKKLSYQCSQKRDGREILISTFENVSERDLISSCLETPSAYTLNGDFHVKDSYNIHQQTDRCFVLAGDFDLIGHGI